MDLPLGLNFQDLITNQKDFPFGSTALLTSLLENDRIKIDEIIVEIVDAELIKDQEYGSMGKNPVDRVKTLLGKLDSMRRNQERGYDVSEEIRHTSNKFVGRVEKIFKNMPKPMEWLSFFNHDLPLLLSTCKEVQDASIQRAGKT